MYTVRITIIPCTLYVPNIILQVCGTDKVTYDSSCHLRTLSANARVDHTGACEEDTTGMMTGMQLCDKTRTDNRCPRADCMTRVMPREGCCPICGESMCTKSPVNHFYSNYGHLREGCVQLLITVCFE